MVGCTDTTNINSVYPYKTERIVHCEILVILVRHGAGMIMVSPQLGEYSCKQMMDLHRTPKTINHNYGMGLNNLSDTLY